jgi:SprT-like family.
MKDLQRLFLESKMELDAIGIEYSKNIVSCDVTNRTAIFGNCRKSGNNYYILISKQLLQDNITDEATKETIIHELLHTCKNCMCHTGEWKRLAQLVSDCYYKYDITRTSSFESKGIERQVAYKYTCKCKKCGKIVGKTRMCDFIKYPNLYTHTNCGGTFERC